MIEGESRRGATPEFHMQEAMHKTANSLSILPAVRHGFFGTQGGVSEGPFSTLNADYRFGDSHAFVSENRRRALETLTGGAPPLFTMEQVHGREVCVLTLSNLQMMLQTPPQADGVVTKLFDVALGILTADCGALLWVDPEASVIGACHAGWRGALGGVIEETFSKMQDLGACKTRIRIALGPMIHQKSYEVRQEFYEQFLKTAPCSSPFFQRAQDKYLFDLQGFIGERIRDLGVKSLECLPYDTFETAFFSYRRAITFGHGICGRNLSLIQNLSQKNRCSEKL